MAPQLPLQSKRPTISSYANETPYINDTPQTANARPTAGEENRFLSPNQLQPTQNDGARLNTGVPVTKSTMAQASQLMPSTQTKISTTAAPHKRIKVTSGASSPSDTSHSSAPPSPKVKKATQALTIGAGKEAVIEALLKQEPTPNPIIQAIRQYLPWLTTSIKPAVEDTTHEARNEDTSALAKDILATFKANRYDEAPKAVPGIMDALRYFKENNTHVIFCTNANALKVSREWTSIVQENWKTLTGLQVPDQKKLTHIFHGNTPDTTQTTNWADLWQTLATSAALNARDTTQPSEAKQTGFRIDIMGKCGKGKLPLNYPEVSPRENLNPHSLANLGVTTDSALHFVGNEIKDAAAARYLQDQGFDVHFYFLNTGELSEAIDCLESHVAELERDHPDYEEQFNLLTHCKKWDLANWAAVQRVTDGSELLEKIRPALQQTHAPKVLMDFHGTISDQLQAFTDLVEAHSPTGSSNNSVA